MLFFYVDIFAQIQLSISINSCEQLNRKFFACCLHDRPGGEAGKNRQSWKNFVKKSSVRENFLRCAVPLFILNANFMNKETLILSLPNRF